jgi:hypothetical protein
MREALARQGRRVLLEALAAATVLTAIALALPMP